MTENTVRLANGQYWTSQRFLDHYFEPSASGTPTPVAGPPAPVDVDMSWYMGEGPGRYYNPGMFPIIGQIADNRHLAPGTYNLLDLVPNRDEKHPSLTAEPGCLVRHSISWARAESWNRANLRSLYRFAAERRSPQGICLSPQRTPVVAAECDGEAAASIR